MNRNKRSTVIGAALVVLGILVGILLGTYLVEYEDDPRGSLLKWPQGGFLKPLRATTAPEPTVPAGPASPMGITFTAADARKIAMQYGSDCRYRPNVEELLLQKLNWDLSGPEPAVLIIHTHASESYTKTAGQDYAQTAEYRTLDTEYNMVALGDRLTQLLEQAGISVLHDRQIHDYPSYNNSYTNARQSAQAYLKQYPSIQVVLDLHRDAVLDSDGSQFAPTVTAGGERIAKLMLVVGTNASGMHHPNWQENLAAALKLQVLLESQVPGITRPVLLRAQRFNHDLADGAMIVEIGAAGNTLQEAMAAVPCLAQALISLMHGTTANSTS